MSSKEDNVRVVVRCRPLLPDLESNEEIIIKIGNDNQTIQLSNRQFTFDRVFDWKSTENDVYTKSAKHIVDCVLQGYNGTIFAYGQTGTGKTFTASGIMQNSFEHIFDHIQRSKNNQKFLVRASYYEIYNEEIRDLLVANSGSKKNIGQKTLELKENQNGKIIIKDLSNFVINNVMDLKKLKETGDKYRSFGSTRMNQRSSRSHTIFTITIETEIGADNPETSIVRVGKFHLIDLAGSERQTKTGTTGLRLKEAAKINLSLTSLSLVIAALTDPKATFIPYRNSKLTRILSDSLGGNSKTLLIACIGPARINQEETISTLRFASQTKNIKNKPIINEDSKDALLRRFEEQVKELRQQLEEQENDDNNDHDNDNQMNDSTTTKIIPNELLEKLKQLEAKICIGGENLLEKAEMQEKLIVESERELIEQREKEDRLRKELEQRQQEILEIEDSYVSLQEEIQALNRKIRKAYGFLKESRSELDDMNVEHEKLRSELLDSIRISEKEIKLTNALISYYIPETCLKLIEDNVQYNQLTGEWNLRCLAYTGNNMRNEYEFFDNGNDAINDENHHHHHHHHHQNYDNIYLSYSNLNLN
ncbi:kinesin-like protein KIF3A [Dermatophagoides pteronyssinus]|uniref:Kinesin-like protein n=1 Tax=Dermatophagoides pteronyssinus TaxID=6956 RepID=A0A6P6Y823_DERPT|nr:kinesin-like protein KIF3A [Dermatophagoides pteronyssinus]